MWLLLLFSAVQGSVDLAQLANQWSVAHVESSFFTDRAQVPDDLSFHLEAFGQSVHVDLQRKTEMFRADYSEKRFQYGADGRNITQLAAASLRTQCFYKNKLAARGQVVSVNTCKEGFTGLVLFGGKFFGLAPAAELLSQTELHQHLANMSTWSPRAQHTLNASTAHVIYQVKHLARREGACGVSSDAQHEHKQPDALVDHLLRSVNLNAQPTTPHLNQLSASEKWVELLVVNDFARYGQLGQETELDSSAIVSLVDDLYSSAYFAPSLRIVLSGQVTFTDGDPYTTLGGDCEDCRPNEVSVVQLLSNFHGWRMSEKQAIQHHDNAQLFSGFDFEGLLLGYAGLGTMCIASQSGGVEQISGDHVFSASVVAHEMGHNLGLRHDGVENDCKPSGFIMNSLLSNPPDQFSPCSFSYYEDSVGNFACLDNVPNEQWGDSVCGNGFTEEGEDCDCGHADCSKTDPCCDGETCKLKNALCSTEEACCIDCRPAAKGTMCREARGDCDMPEVCTGKDSSCPPDLYVGAGYACADVLGGPGRCFEGLCASHEAQCHEVGEGFPDAPYGACSVSKQTAYNDGNFCGTLLCGKQGQCWTFPGGDELLTQVADGVPCGDKQCVGGSCVTPTSVSDSVRWDVTPIEWTPSTAECKTCLEEQHRTVQCVLKLPSGAEEFVDDKLCAQSKPKAVQLCHNPALHCDESNANQIAHAVAAKYDVEAKADWLRALVPRLYSPHTIDVLASPQQQEPYFTGVLLLSIYGLSVALLGCCGGCRVHGSRKETATGGCCSSPPIPFATICVTVLATLALVPTCYFLTAEGSRGFSAEPNGAAPTLLTTMDEAVIYAGKLREPLSYLREQTPGIADNLASALTAASTLGGSFDTMLTSLSEMATALGDMQEVTIPGDSGSPSIVLRCLFCSETSSELSLAHAELRSAGQPLYDIKYYSQVVDALVQQQDDVVEGATVVLREVEALKKDIVTAQPPTSQTVDQVTSYDSVRNGITCFVLVVPLLASFVTMLGVCCTKTDRFLQWGASLGMGVVFCMGVLLAVHLPLGVAVGDSCDSVDKIESNLVGALGEDGGLVVEACLLNTSILSALNNSKLHEIDFDFISVLAQLEEMSIPDAETDFSFEELNDIEARLTTMDMVGFGFDSQTTDSHIDDLNRVTQPQGRVYTRDTVASCNPNLFTNPAEVSRLRGIVITDQKAEALIISTMAQVTHNVSELQRLSDEVRRNAVELEADWSDIEVILAPLEAAVRSIVDNSYCGFIGVNYATMKTSYCGATGSSFMMLSLMLLLLAIVHAMASCCAVRLRISRKGVDGSVNMRNLTVNSDSNAYQQMGPERTV